MKENTDQKNSKYGHFLWSVSDEDLTKTFPKLDLIRETNKP